MELYTGGAYSTGDLDFVGQVPASVEETLREHGFTRKGRHWIHEEARVFLQRLREALARWSRDEPTPEELTAWASQKPNG